MNRSYRDTLASPLGHKTCRPTVHVPISPGGRRRVGHSANAGNGSIALATSRRHTAMRRKTYPCKARVDEVRKGGPLRTQSGGLCGPLLVSRRSTHKCEPLENIANKCNN